MKNNVLEYKGYHTTVEFDAETFKLRGKIEGINDFVNFETEDPKNIEQEFRLAVDDYLAFCEMVGKEPDKEYKGTFNVRIDPELHKKIAVMASKNGDSLNVTVEKAIRAYVSTETITNLQLKQSIDVLSAVINNQTSYIPQDISRICVGTNIVNYTDYNPTVKFKGVKTN